jgi:hypothetical protein
MFIRAVRSSMRRLPDVDLGQDSTVVIVLSGLHTTPTKCTRACGPTSTPIYFSETPTDVIMLDIRARHALGAPSLDLHLLRDQRTSVWLVENRLGPLFVSNTTWRRTSTPSAAAPRDAHWSWSGPPALACSRARVAWHRSRRIGAWIARTRTRRIVRHRLRVGARRTCVCGYDTRPARVRIRFVSSLLPIHFSQSIHCF